MCMSDQVLEYPTHLSNNVLHRSAMPNGESHTFRQYQLWGIAAPTIPARFTCRSGAGGAREKCEGPRDTTQGAQKDGTSSWHIAYHKRTRQQQYPQDGVGSSSTNWLMVTPPRHRCVSFGHYRRLNATCKVAQPYAYLMPTMLSVSLYQITLPVQAQHS